MYKWLFNYRNAGAQFFDNMQLLLTQKNVNGLMRFLITFGVYDNNITEIDFEVAKMVSKAIKLQLELKSALYAFLSITPSF